MAKKAYPKPEKLTLKQAKDLARVIATEGLLTSSAKDQELLLKDYLTLYTRALFEYQYNNPFRRGL